MPVEVNLSAEQVSTVNEGRQFLWFYGFIAYKDFLGEPHETRSAPSGRQTAKAEPAPLASFGKRDSNRVHKAHQYEEVAAPDEQRETTVPTNGAASSATETNRGECDGMVCAFWNWIRRDNLTAVSTVVIAAFTVVLAWVGYCQARLLGEALISPLKNLSPAIGRASFCGTLISKTETFFTCS